MEDLTWKRMMFKGCKVYAEVDDSGNARVRNGRITIKYQLHQEHEYQARADAVQKIDEAPSTKRSPAKKPSKKNSRINDAPTLLAVRRTRSRHRHLFRRCL